VDYIESCRNLSSQKCPGERLFDLTQSVHGFWRRDPRWSITGTWRGDQCKGAIFDILAMRPLQYNHQDSLAISSA
jgi:hypothetical protein